MASDVHVTSLSPDDVNISGRGSLGFSLSRSQLWMIAFEDVKKLMLLP